MFLLELLQIILPLDLRSFKMKKTLILYLFFLFFHIDPILCQPSPSLDSLTSITLKQAGDSILKGSNDSIRLRFQNRFYGLMDSILTDEHSFTFSFDSIKTLAVHQSPDKKLRVYNWLLPLQRGNEFRYFGFIQVNDKKLKKISTYILKEKKWTTDSAETLKLNCENWYGALYYKILEHKYNGKTFYTILGWQGKDLQSTRKVIDVIVLNNGKPQLGAPIFKTGGKTKTRIIFEYNAQTTMSLKYDESDKRIVFDHLSPSDPRPEAKKMFSLYGPDMTYDALKFEKGFWVLQKNIQPRNNREEKQKEVPLEKKFRITHKK